MDKPIERVVQPASGTAGNSRTFRNAETGELYGIEVEGRKEFDIGDDFSQSFFVALNASVIESEVNLADGTSRKLQGQPDYTFNLVMGYDDFASGHQITLLINQNGESIPKRSNATPAQSGPTSRATPPKDCWTPRR